MQDVLQAGKRALKNWPKVLSAVKNVDVARAREYFELCPDVRIVREITKAIQVDVAQLADRNQRAWLYGISDVIPLVAQSVVVLIDAHFRADGFDKQRSGCRVRQAVDVSRQLVGK